MPRVQRLFFAFSLSAATLALPSVAHGSDHGGYVVVDGDTLIGIASRHQVSVAALLSANDLVITSVIQPGQQLTIPGSTSSTGPSATGGPSYTIRAGDTLIGIASRHQVSLAALLSANNLAITSLIQPGQQLTIPGSTSNATPAATGGPSYTIRAGDTLIGIASRHRVSLGSLLSANDLAVTSVIQPGQQLTIPAGGIAPSTTSTTPAAAGGLRYTIRAGDTLIGIASRHRVSLSSLLSANSLAVTSVIQPGQQLTIPAGGLAPSPEPASSGTKVDAVLAFARAQLGKPYRFFTAGPSTFDCSGLTLAAYAQIGVNLFHHSATQARQGTAVDFRSSGIRAGDLVFMSTRGSAVINHVGIATSPTTWIQARRPGEVVRLGPIPHTSLITEVRRFVN